MHSLCWEPLCEPKFYVFLYLGPRLKLASCESALTPPPPPPPVVYSTDRSKALVPVLVLVFVAFVVHCTRRFVLCYSVLVFFLLALRLPRLGKRELILMLFVRLVDLCLFGFVCFLFLLVSGMGCGLRLWHSLDVSLTFCFLM